jgi:hypothetical protein
MKGNRIITEVLERFSQPISPHDMSGRGYPVKMAELLARMTIHCFTLFSFYSVRCQGKGDD